MISIRNLLKIYKSGHDSVRAVDGVSIEVGAQEFFVLLGLSGSGKTTLLRCVAGLEKPDDLPPLPLTEEPAEEPEEATI